MQTRSISALPRGASFTRAVVAMILHRGSTINAAEFAEHQFRDSPDTAEFLKTAVSAGTSNDSNWANALPSASLAASEFAEILRAGSIAGRLTGLRRIPFSTSVLRQTAAASVGWVGQGAAIPVSGMTLSTDTLGIAKIGGLAVVTQELARAATKSLDALALIQADLTRSAIDFLDQQFISPAVAAVVNVSPASITNSITAIQATGTTATATANDLTSLLTAMADANETDSLFLVMTRADAVRLAARRDTAGGLAFPDVKISGGNVFGVPVITTNGVPHSTSAGGLIVAINASGILFAESSNVELAVSMEGSIEMSDTPTESSVTPTASTVVSMLETNSAAIRMILFRNWLRVRSSAVGLIDNWH